MAGWVLSIDYRMDLGHLQALIKTKVVKTGTQPLTENNHRYLRIFTMKRVYGMGCPKR
jgi:hypothetical protein